jgi:UDP-N-acetylglucosamine--dolichyl-phosphate N-acetylglucosaminephosphotransferase
VLPSLLYLLYQYFALPIEMHTTLLAICFVILLGFFDDILDLPWRIKIILPLIATIPIL